MPYKWTHFGIAALAPAILIAFWPNYFGVLGQAPFALHLHGFSAALWLVLVAGQSWTIHARQRVVHRSLGLASFILVPLFATGSLLAMQGMMGLGLAAADPFHAAYGVRLALADAVSVVAFLALIHASLVNRRNVWIHGGSMVATVWLVLPPILARLLPLLPGLPESWAGLDGFTIAFHLAQAAVVVGAILFAWQNRRAASPMLIVASALLFESLLFETVARSDGWLSVARMVVSVPAWAMALVGLLFGSAVMVVGWQQGSTGKS